MSPPVRPASKDESQTIRMVIKDQDAAYGLAGAGCCRQTACLPHDEDPPGEGGPFGNGRHRTEVVVFVMSPDGLDRERHCSLRKITSFHDSHRTTTNVLAATTRASDLHVPLRE